MINIGVISSEAMGTGELLSRESLGKLRVTGIGESGQITQNKGHVPNIWPELQLWRRSSAAPSYGRHARIYLKPPRSLSFSPEVIAAFPLSF